MIESGSQKGVDFLISINSDKNLRIKRIINRDNISKKEVLSRIKEQVSDKERAKYSDIIIVNDGRHSLIEQVLNIHLHLLKK